MAESDVSAVKVYNYICEGNGGFAEFSQLLKHPSPLSKKLDEDSVRYWFKIQKLSGSFDSDHALVMTTNQHGRSRDIITYNITTPPQCSPGVVYLTLKTEYPIYQCKKQ